jgi:predicted MFS family arabinose efflux permease
MAQPASLSTPVADPAPSTKVAARAWIVLLMLVCVYTFSWIDRFLLIILIDPISKDLKVSNTEIGLLTGFGTSLLYSLAGFPIARLADKGSRKLIITAAIGAWSTLTVLSGFVGNFIGLALARFGIAISSAGCSPAAYSLISDYFPQARRGAAIAIYSLGISIGMWAGLTFGGMLEDHFGWRSAFLMVGFPGMAMATLFFFVVREPKRGTYDSQAGGQDKHYSLKEAAGHILGHPCFMLIALGFGLTSAAASAFENWVPTYMIRVQHMTSTEVGSISGLFQGVTGFVGTLIFGFAADKLGARDVRWYIWLPIMGFAVMGPATILFFHAPGNWAYVCYFLTELAGSAFSAPLFAAGQMLLPPRLRAVGMASLLFVLNVVGMGAGPFLTGWLSDLFVARGAVEGLAPSISLMQLSGLCGVACLVLASLRLKQASIDQPVSA